MPDLSAVGELLNRLVGAPVSGTFGVFLVIHNRLLGMGYLAPLMAS